VWLCEQSGGRAKILIKRRDGRPVLATYSRVMEIPLRSRDEAPKVIADIVAGYRVRYGDVVIHDRGEEILVELSESLVRLQAP